jgi:hypothetical protein
VQNDQCGTIAVLSAGQCSQNSDCGDTTRYACNWDSSKLQGTCVPIQQQQNQTCTNDYQCTQTAPTCNSKQYGSQKCVSGSCQVVKQDVACCSSSDCSPGFFCNSQFTCEKSQSQLPQCPAGQCCEGNPNYQDRTCRDMTGGSANVCCADGTCASTAAGCKAPPTTCTKEGLQPSNIAPCCDGLTSRPSGLFGTGTVVCTKGSGSDLNGIIPYILLIVAIAFFAFVLVHTKKKKRRR